MAATNKKIKHKELPEGYKYCDGYIIPEEWSTVRFDSVFKRLIRKNAENNQNVLTISAQQGLISQMDYYNTLYASEDKTGYSLLEKGDFAYNKSYSSDYAYGAIKCLEKYDKGIVSPLYICFSSPNGTNTEFFKQYFEAGRFNREIYRIAQEGARNHGLLNISTEEFFASVLVLPPADEQKRISEILLQCDKTIELCECKIEELKKQKSFFFHEMFPCYGCDVPNIRFPGFESPWEKRRFSEFTFATGKKNKNDLPLTPYAITNECGFVPQSEAHDEFGYMKDTDRRAYNIVTPNSFAYNPARINVGSLGYYRGNVDVIVSSLYEVFQTTNIIYDDFLWHWFKSSDFSRWIERLQEGSVRLYFYYDKLCECLIRIPCIEEQKKIAAFFDNIDTQISLNQRKLDEMKRLKKALMQLLLTGLVRVKT